MPRIIETEMTPRTNISESEESMLAYLEHRNRLLIEQNQQQHQTLLDQVKFINKCSSYIDRKQQYNQFANMFVNNNQSAKASKNNIKKLGQCISSKFKKLIHINATLSAHRSSRSDSNEIRLVNFNYKEAQTPIESSVKKLTRKPSIRPAMTQSTRVNERYYSNYRPVAATKSRSSLHSNSSNGSSTSSGSCCDSGMVSDPRVFMTHLGLDGHMETSTPLTSSRIHQYPNMRHIPFVVDENFGSDECTEMCCCDECENGGRSEQQINMALFMDQSTQVPVDSPVLIESTFNNSSLSNLSDDLIIVQQTGHQETSNRPAPLMTPTPVSYRKSSFMPGSASMRPQNGSSFVPFVPPRGVSLSRNITPWL